MVNQEDGGLQRRGRGWRVHLEIVKCFRRQSCAQRWWEAVTQISAEVTLQEDFHSFHPLRALAPSDPKSLHCALIRQTTLHTSFCYVSYFLAKSDTINDDYNN
ncbi:hypothetical protein CEXT_452551 [Caerostris extrusa]|uniref:Uncharacterized protein n=1 Tax=Caerostris extrusa TaxID=172846 RepID=A0AAV4SP18_CAEEX|nr:hypothetical protein CEXT_452551 [Caerostris extrusa]